MDILSTELKEDTFSLKMDQEVFKILSNAYYQQNKDHIIEKKIYNKEKHKKEFLNERKEKNENKTKIKKYNHKLVMAVNDGTNIVKFTF